MAQDVTPLREELIRQHFRALRLQGMLKCANEKRSNFFFLFSEESNNEALEATSDVTVEPKEFDESKQEQIWTKDPNGPDTNRFTLESYNSKFLTATENNTGIEGNYEQSDSLQSVWKIGMDICCDS